MNGGHNRFFIRLKEDMQKEYNENFTQKEVL